MWLSMPQTLWEGAREIVEMVRLEDAAVGVDDKRKSSTFSDMILRHLVSGETLSGGISIVLGLLVMPPSEFSDGRFASSFLRPRVRRDHCLLRAILLDFAVGLLGEIHGYIFSHRSRPLPTKCAAVETIQKKCSTGCI